MKRDGTISIEKISDSTTNSTQKLHKTNAQTGTADTTGRKTHDGMGAIVMRGSGGQRNTVIGVGGWLVP